LSETRLVKSRERVLRDSTISMPRSRAADRAFTIETPPDRIGHRPALSPNSPWQAAHCCM